jgi:Winged helix DNA-binding domain
VSAGGVIAERLASQLLAGSRAPDPTTVVDRLLAVQAQDPRGARLAIRARSDGLSAAVVDRALSEERSLLITWLNRGTLHLVRREDYPWLQALTTPPVLRPNARRLAQEGVTEAAAERGVAAIVRALGAEGPLTRGTLRERVATAGVPTGGQALVHLLLLASLRGLIVRGPMLDAEHAYALVTDWLGEPPPVDRGRALAELCRRYLLGHAPADDRDVARWSGLALRDVRAGLESIAGELRERPDGLVELAGRRAVSPPPLPPTRLLGAFDPLLLGWCSREELLAGNAGIVTTNGIFRPFALVEGRAAATWSLSRRQVVLSPFGRLTRDVRLALEREAQDVLRYLGLGVEAPAD